MQLPIYQVDAFASAAFKGNPAAVVPLQTWLEDTLLQAIANENNLSETAFIFKQADDYYDLRWFTPTVEVDLCGHATLAAASIIFNEWSPELDTVRFETRSGELTVTRDHDRLLMRFPSLKVEQVEIPELLYQAFADIDLLEVYHGMDYLVVVEDEETVRSLTPDLNLLARLDARGICVTAKGNDCDFVSRFFAPAAGLNEDPVTGSSHCMLTPYWSRQLAKPELHARQLSSRGGELWCRDMGDIIELKGAASLYLKGYIFF